jgi:hypothetical protein
LALAAAEPAAWSLLVGSAVLAVGVAFLWSPSAGTMNLSISSVNHPGFGGGSLVESQATRLVRSPSSYRASNSVGGLYPQAP